MGDSLQEFFQRFELLAFFAGYPLLFSLTVFLGMLRPHQPVRQEIKLQEQLPKSYALAATLFILFALRQAWLENTGGYSAGPSGILLLEIWGSLAALFWIPLFRKKPVYSFFHSLIFFLLILKDLVSGMGSLSGRDQIRNDMRILTVSLLINSVLLGIVCLFVFLSGRRQRNRS